MYRILSILFIFFSTLCANSQNTRFINVNASINTPQQNWTLNSVYAKPFYTILTWTVKCKDLTSSVYIPENVYIEDMDSHIRYGLAKKPTVVNPSTFNQTIKYEVTFKGIPATTQRLKFVAPNFTINDIVLSGKKNERIEKTINPVENNSIDIVLEENPIPKDEEIGIVSEVDLNIPITKDECQNTFAVIIANENYAEVEKVPYAIKDGKTFEQYCTATLGIPSNNIRYITDATLNNIRRQLSWLSQVMEAYNGEANVIFYYAGHGIPDEKNGNAYLLPVDGYGSDITTGYGLDKLYSDLSSKPAKSVLVLLDACFSGARRDGGMLASARGVAIKAKQNAPKGNMVVLSAAQGDETAYPYKEKGHGMFTYYLLKKLQETKGNATIGEIADYVTAEVKKQSIVVNGKMQTPLVSPSTNATDWRNWKLR